MSLPRWDPSLSDGCSVPRALRWLIRTETPACRACCLSHDESYFRGGTAEDRLNADTAFMCCLISAGMPKALAQLYFLSVRAGGVPWLRIPKVSWGFGGNRFVYDPENK